MLIFLPWILVSYREYELAHANLDGQTGILPGYGRHSLNPGQPPGQPVVTVIDFAVRGALEAPDTPRGVGRRIVDLIDGVKQSGVFNRRATGSAS